MIKEHLAWAHSKQWYIDLRPPFHATIKYSLLYCAKCIKQKKKKFEKVKHTCFWTNWFKFKILVQDKCVLNITKDLTRKKKRLVQCPVTWWERHDIHSTLLQVYSTTVRKIGLHYIPSGCKDMKDNKKQNNTRKIKI